MKHQPPSAAHFAAAYANGINALVALAAPAAFSALAESEGAAAIWSAIRAALVDLDAVEPAQNPTVQRFRRVVTEMIPLLMAHRELSPPSAELQRLALGALTELEIDAPPGGWERFKPS